ncbi:MAG: HNH endonuclease signature motif containing protein [Bradyrhizobium sp.]|uniref:HNH endonuclease n=1 Tax=Bradyrhizobium sp. TaxID=376 RepID=UPI0029AB71BB|nr:HNH endonuclease signature motif containing protein [Bradyrhizobium sp.]MDX3966783.1 HNH endonuclease signature motif containing protein [Bradyrhizobium sp.]
MPLTNIEKIRLDKAAVDEGFGLRRDDDGAWLAYDSLGAPASIRLTCTDQRYIVAVNHVGVAADIAERWQKWPQGTEPLAPPGFAAFVVSDTAPLHHLVREIWRLARALPIEPLRVFEAQTRNLPRTTEAERLVVQRVGQDVFRDALMTYWGGRCAVTGVAEPRLLRASHIKPWARCETDAERLDVYNGLLLAAHLDAAFDAGLVSFSDEGAILFSSQFAQEDRDALGIHGRLALRRVAGGHLPNLAWHRTFLLGASA